MENCEDANLKTEVDGAIDYYCNGNYDEAIPYQGEVAAVDGWGAGGGLQYEFPIKIEWLIKLGLLKEVF